MSTRPTAARVSMSLRNIDAWYDAFAVSAIGKATWPRRIASTVLGGPRVQTSSSHRLRSRASRAAALPQARSGWLWVMRKDQLEALTSTVRHDIIDHLVALGPLSVAGLAMSLQRRPTAVYAHLRRLERVGLVVAVQVRRRRGRPALLYQAIAPLIRLARAPRDPANRAVMARIAKAVASQAAKDYRKAFQRSDCRIEGPARNHWIFRSLSAASPNRLRRINSLLDELARLIWTPDPKPGRLISLTWLLSPIGANPSPRSQ
jgi:predicted transcriptional regulator